MQGRSFPLSLLLVSAILALQLQAVPIEENELVGRGTCENEERYENQVMCRGQPSGELMPYPGNCNLYLTCDCVYPTVKRCPADLWFNNEMKTCDYPQNTKCIDYDLTTSLPTASTGTPLTVVPSTRPTTQITPTPTKGTTSSSDSEITQTTDYDPPPPPPGIEDSFCANLPDGSVHRYPYNCNAYINCTHGWPVLNYCEPDKVFNQLLLICDTPDTAQCEELPLPSPTTPMTTLTTTEAEECGAAPEGVEEQYCEPLGNGFYEYPYDCSAYITCHNGCTGIQYCIPEKLFNPLLHICDTPNSVVCNPLSYPTSTPSSVSSTHSEPTSAGTGSSTTSTQSTTVGLPSDVDPNICLDKPDNTILPYAGNCAEFILCMNQDVVMQKCSTPLVFNPDLLICDNADDVLCYGDRTTEKPTSPVTTEISTTASTPTTQRTTPNPNEQCVNSVLGDTYPYEADCQKYVLCTGNGTYFLANCIANTWYDPKTGDCGRDVSPTACKDLATDTTTTLPTTSEPTTSPTTVSVPTTAPPTSNGICGDKINGEMINYPKDCSKYIVCVQPIPVAFYCTDGFYFSLELQECTTWDASDCENSGETTATTPSPATTRPPPQFPMCTESDRDTFPYPDNCKWFIRCVNDVPMMHVCNCGEYYDPWTGVCGADVPPDACREDYTSTTESTTPATRPPPQKGPCDDVEDGALVPYPNDCTKYIKCDRPIAVAYECDDGDEFSEQLGKCVEASLANCKFTSTEGSTAASTATYPTPPTAGSTTPKPTETSPIEPPTRSTTEGSTSSEVTTESTTTETPSGGLCAGKLDGTLVPYPYNCSKYIVCADPIPIGYDCYNNLEFSPTELMCMEPEQANCQAITIPTPSTKTTTSIPPESTPESRPSSTESTATTPSTPASTAATIPPDTPNICCGHTLGTRLPYPNNCSRYIVCDYPIPYPVDCAEGTIFDQQALECTAASNESCLFEVN
ncbi:mucin-2 [Scaptodrosophila lebanonensis]|uniref:Mucin-2 n=1 Tax=Drosophila lebanonensis TaxID=7225 RepID=A0A6J2TAJ1_DROLE|nr:mucin-2 [Scaptodrosophila lebanonensis]